MKTKVQTINSKRFVVRQSLIGKNTVIKVTFKDGKTAEYDHDQAYEVMKDKLLSMNCWAKYKSYTSSSNLPVAVRAIARQFLQTKQKQNQIRILIDNITVTNKTKQYVNY